MCKNMRNDVPNHGSMHYYRALEQAASRFSAIGDNLSLGADPSSVLWTDVKLRSDLNRGSGSNEQR